MLPTRGSIVRLCGAVSVSEGAKPTSMRTYIRTWAQLPQARRVTIKETIVTLESITWLQTAIANVFPTIDDA